MKLIFMFLVVCSVQLTASVYSQNTKLTLEIRNSSLVDVIKEIRNNSEFTFVYDLEDVEGIVAERAHYKKASVEEILEDCLSNTTLTYQVIDKVVILKQAAPEPNIQQQAQTITIAGKVVDETGEALPFVNVYIKGDTKGVISDKDGNYTIEVRKKPNMILVASFIGFETKEIEVGDQENIDITLESTESALDEVVVIGYGTSKIKDLTGSISRVSQKEIEKAPMGASVQTLLQGRAAGVNIAIQSASPTSPVSVIIRGASSISGDNQPLWVIDGVPEYSSSTSGNIANTLYNLNLNDVKSIDILKDASATALYGSRAANGVVLVTTKKGEEGMEPTIQISSKIGFQKMDLNGFKYMETPEYLNFIKKAIQEGVRSTGDFGYFDVDMADTQSFYELNTSEFDGSEVTLNPDYFYDSNTNYLEDMTQNPINHQQDISIRGGTKKTSYFISFNHNKMDGIVKSGGSELFGGRVNFEAKVRKGIKTGIVMSGSFRDTDDKDYMLDVLKKVRPDIPPFNEDGSIYTEDEYTENPYTTLLNTESGKGKTLSTTGFFEATVIEGLMLKSAYTVNYANSQNLSYKRRGSTHEYLGSRSWSQTENTTNVWENTATLAKTFGNHDILALAGFSMEKNSIRGFSIAAENFPDDDVLNNFSSAANAATLGEYISEHSLISQFGRMHYKFKNRYIISGTLRRDGSSRFGPDKRWGIFPSGAAAWLISEEDFMKSGNIQNYISYLKLRLSIGKAGSQNLGNYDWRTQVTADEYNGNPTIQPTTIGNYNLQWEETTMKDLALDFGLWKERIRGSIGVYEKITDEIIYNRPLPPSSAFTSIASNVASIKNSGLEFDIKVDVIKKENLLLTLDFNTAKNKNVFMEVSKSMSEISSSRYLIEQGKETGIWYGYQTANRLFVTQEEIIANQTVDEEGTTENYRTSTESVGDIYFVDQNGDGQITTEDKVELGSAQPKFFGGFGATLQYKGLMVNTTFSYSTGNKRFWQMPSTDVGYVGNYNQAVSIAGNSATLLSPYDAAYPRMTTSGLGDNDTFSDYFLYDASFIRLNSLNINYRLPKRLFENMIIDALEFTFQATNLFTLTSYPGFDPQGNFKMYDTDFGSVGMDYSSYPSAKTFSLGVKLTFK